MSFSTGNRVDDRRRRVLSDEVVARTAKAKARSDDGPGQPGPAYTESALDKNLPRLADFIPLRYLSVALSFTCFSGAAAGILYAADKRASWSSASGLSLSMFGLDEPGTLSSAFASFVFLACAVCCLAIHGMRRHRVADYQARYRIWAYMCWCCGGAALVLNSHILTDAREALHLATNWPAFKSGSTWWPLISSSPFIAILALLSRELCESKRSAASLFLASGCWIAAILFQGNWIHVANEAAARLTTPSCFSAGSIAFLLALVLHRRFLWEEIHGSESVAKASSTMDIGSNAPTESKTTKRAVNQPTTKRQRVQPPHFSRSREPFVGRASATAQQPSPPIKRTAASAGTSTATAPSSVEGKTRLTKAERKAMRKRRLLEQAEDQEDQRWIR